MSLIEFNGRQIDPRAQLLDLDRADCEDSLYEFYRQAWPYIDPRPWVDGWCMQAIAEHLEAVSDGEISRLLINISPRCSKSNLTSVAFPAWVWAQTRIGPISGPQVSFIGSSYAHSLSVRDTRKSRQLIESAFYQQRWGERFSLTSDQNTKSRFANNKGGERLTTSVDGTNTGEGAMCIIIDDPNSVDDLDSELTIQAAIDWWDGTMTTRLNDQNTGAYIVIQQRTFENDLTGHILETEVDDWVHLMIPMRYEPERSFHTVTGWKDPRTEAGQLMWPERFDEQAVSRIERRLGDWRAAGQLQQRPAPKGGGVIKREWWRLWNSETYPPMDYIIGCLDTAYTLDRMNDPSGMMIWGVFSPDRTSVSTHMMLRDNRKKSEDQRVAINPQHIEHTPHAMCMFAWTERYEFHQLVEKTVDTARRMKIDLLLIENKAAGLSVGQEIRRLYQNERFAVQFFDPKSQDKFARLVSVQNIFQEGLVYAPDHAWTESVITQVGQFPRGVHDEYVDLTSMGLRHFRDRGLLKRGAEIEHEMELLKAYPEREEPLYAC